MTWALILFWLKHTVDTNDARTLRLVYISSLQGAKRNWSERGGLEKRRSTGTSSQHVDAGESWTWSMIFWWTLSNKITICGSQKTRNIYVIFCLLCDPGTLFPWPIKGIYYYWKREHFLMLQKEVAKTVFGDIQCTSQQLQNAFFCGSATELVPTLHVFCSHFRIHVKRN